MVIFSTPLDFDKCKNNLVKIILRLIAYGYKHAINFKAEEKLECNIVKGAAR